MENLTDLQRLEALIELVQMLDRNLLHSHQCSACNHCWSHNGTHAGSEQSHMCPRCNTGPYWVRT